MSDAVDGRFDYDDNLDALAHNERHAGPYVLTTSLHVTTVDAADVPAAYPSLQRWSSNASRL